MQKSIVLVAHDAAPSRCFNLLTESIRETRGDITVTTFISDGKPVEFDGTEMATAISKARFVLIGMSSDAIVASIELRAANFARRYGIPFGFYSDTPLASLRAAQGSWFYEHAMHASLFVGLFSRLIGVPEIQRMFPEATYVETGNPLRDLLAHSSTSIDEARKRLCVEDKKHVIVAPGGKFAAGNLATWMLLIEAIQYAGFKDEVALILPLHPGDRTPHAVDAVTGSPLRLYDELVEDSPITTIIPDPGRHSISDVVAAASLVVEFTGSASILAAYWRIPVLSIYFEVWASRFARESAGIRSVELTERGAALSITPSLRDVADVLPFLLNSESHYANALRVAQEEAYPTPVPNESLGRIMKELFRIVDR